MRQSSKMERLDELAAAPWSHSIATLDKPHGMKGVSAMTRHRRRFARMRVLPHRFDCDDLAHPGKACGCSIEMCDLAAQLGHIVMPAYRSPAAERRYENGRPSSLAAPSIRRTGWPINLNCA